MVSEHRIINIFGKKVFEKAMVTPPFKRQNPLPNEACLLYFLEGGNNSYSEEGHVTINRDDGVLMKCGNYMYDVIADNKTGKAALIAIHLYPDVLEKIYERELPVFLMGGNNHGIKNNMAPVRSNLFVKKFMENMLLYFDYPSRVDEEMIILKLKEIILLLLKTEDAPAIKNIMYNLFSPSTFSFKEIVEAHIFSPIMLNDLAALTNNSLSSFKRKFRKIYDDSPTNYIKNQRLDKAAKLLLLSDEPVSYIAYDCGFNDIAYFSTSFKTKFQKTPSQYRLGRSQK